jgi:hypothetical protein
MVRRSALGEVARYVAIGGGALILISLFLPWIDEGFSGSQSGFEIFGKYDVFIAVLAAVAITLAVVDWFVKWRGLLPMVAALGAFLLADPVVTLLEFSLDGHGIGYWLHVIGAVALTSAGLMALIDSLQAPRAATVAQPAPGPATAGPAPPAPAPPAPPAAAASPQAPAGTPAGWMPDPWGEARLRYWDGSEWTGATAP